MSVTDIVAWIGIAFCSLGGCIEVVGVVAITFCPVRRRMTASPMGLIGWGGVTFFAGLLMTAGTRFFL